MKNKAIEEFQNNVNETLDLFGQIKASNKENFFLKTLLKSTKCSKKPQMNLTIKVSLMKGFHLLFLMTLRF